MLRNARSHGGMRWHAAMLLFVVVFATAFFGSLRPALAQGLNADQVSDVAVAAGVGEPQELPVVIGRIINIALGLIGIILLLLILYAGFLWMTAGGNAEQVETAKKYIRNAIIGLIIIVSAFAITRFLLDWLTGEGFGGGGVTVGGPPGTGFVPSAGSLGGGIIESHYPRRNETGVPRNAAIIVTFKQPIQIDSLIQDYNDAGTPDDRSDDIVTEGINDTSVRIYPTSSGPEGRLTSSEVRVRFTDDRRTFVFRPVNPIGSASENVGYTVDLESGLDGVLLDDGTPAFTGSFSDGYSWTFETGTFIDVTPPRVRGVFPRAGTRVDRNVIIQVQFNEAVDPTAVSGLVADGFDNIRVLAGGEPPVDGTYVISNQYRTVEFIPSLLCGRNACGEDIFCLPEGGGQIETVIRAATIEGEGPAAAFLAAGYDGVVDVAGNSLDGNADGITQGYGLDDYSWRFGLTNDINLTTPLIEETVPPSSIDEEPRSNIDPFDPVRARFDSVIQGSSLNTDTAVLVSHEPTSFTDTFWWTVSQEYLTDMNVPVESTADEVAKSEIVINHRTFATSTLYDPFLFSGIRNIYQNCFNPASSFECDGSPNCCLSQPSAAACQFGP